MALKGLRHGIEEEIVMPGSGAVAKFVKELREEDCSVSKYTLGGALVVFMFEHVYGFDVDAAARDMLTMERRELMGNLQGALRKPGPV